MVTGGFAEVGTGLTVLAERAVLRSKMTQEDFDAMMEEAQNFYTKAQENFVSEPGPVDEAAKMLSDMVAMGEEIGLSSSR